MNVSLKYMHWWVLECGEGIADIVFVLDSSGSIRAAGENNWNLILQFVASVVERLNIGSNNVRVGLVRYANLAYNIFYLNQYTDRQSLRQAILNVRYRDGNTNTSGGIRTMQRDQFNAVNGDRPLVENVGVVITDGKATYDVARTIPDAQNARRLRTRMISVGVTNAIDENELRLISSPPQTKGINYFTSTDFSNLQQLVQALVRSTCITTPVPIPTTPVTTPSTPRRTAAPPASTQTADQRTTKRVLSMGQGRNTLSVQNAA